MSGIRNEHGLTEKQYKFAEAVSRGMGLSDAFRHAFDAQNMKSATIRKRASELMTRGDVRGLVERLVMAERRMVEVQTVTDREMLLQNLRSWTKGEAEATQVQLRAAELLGKACGLYREVVEDHRERPAQVVAAELESRLAGLMDRLNSTPSDEGSGEPGSSQDEVEVEVEGEGEGEGEAEVEGEQVH